MSVFIFGIILLFVFCLFRFGYFNIEKIERVNNPFVVISDYDGYVILESEGNKFIFYDDNTLMKGNRVSIKGRIEELDSNTEFNAYLKTQNIHYIVKGSIEENDKRISFNERIINFLLKNKDKENKEVLELILFNKKSNNNIEFYRSFETFSLNFLIVVSGFHINLLFKILEKTKVLKYFFVVFYVYLLDLAISSLKAFLYYILRKLNKKLNLSLNNMDLLSIIIISLLFINPSYLFNLGFIYTFLFSIGINFINNIIDSKKIACKLLVKALIYMISIPLILSSTYQINVLSFVMTIILDIPISILFVLSLIYLFFDKFYLLYNIYYKLLYCFLEYSKKNSFDLIFGKPMTLVIIFLFLCLIAFLYFYQNKCYKKAFLSMGIYFLILIFQYCIPFIDSREIVYFLDVGQGDCSVLKIPNSKSVVLIDTGGSKYKDVANNDIIPFLKRKGINGIEIVVITHDDFDHNGALDDLKNNFKVSNIIDDSLTESIVIGKSIFKNVNICEGRENDDSIVLYGEYGGIKYLFTGDISKEKEEEIMLKNENMEVDILKVGHHGSNTSSSENFIKFLNPIVALIGVGKNNIYNHPSNEVLERLKVHNIKVYRTDFNGNIIIYKSLFTNYIIIEKEKDML